MKTNPVTLTAALLLVAGCGDREAPAVTIASPTGGNVSGIVSIVAEAGDNTGVTKVEIYVDDSLVAAPATPPYTASWNTTLLGDSTGHKIHARAFDAADNTGLSDTVEVTVVKDSICLIWLLEFSDMFYDAETGDYVTAAVGLQNALSANGYNSVVKSQLLDIEGYAAVFVSTGWFNC